MTHTHTHFKSVLMQALRLLVTTVVFGLIALVATSKSGQAADAAGGKTLALRWCASCHLVADDQQTAASTSLPSFYDMAKDPGWTEDRLATFLADPHPQMPNMTLGNTEIANLSAYISSLSP